MMLVLTCILFLGSINVDGSEDHGPMLTRVSTTELASVGLKNAYSSLRNLFNRPQEETQTNMIFPGTCWCGPGNKAHNDDHLGFFTEEDKCCRDHDKCPNVIEASKSMGRLINDGIFARSNCSCDRDFYQCLKTIGSTVSTAIGMQYFTGLNPQCFAEEHPRRWCIEPSFTNFYRRKCYKWIVNPNGEKNLQWFDNPRYNPWRDYANHVY